MKTLVSIITLLTLLFIGGLSLNAQTSTQLSSSEIEQLREERTITLFNMQNKHDIAKQKAMGETFSLNEEKADLENKRREVQIVDEASFPKYVEMNNSQKAAWEYAQAKKAWVEANPAKYAEMMSGAATN